MKLTFEIDKCADGGYIGTVVGMPINGDGRTVIEAMENVFNSALDVFEIAQNDGIDILNYGDEEENIDLNIPPRKKTKVGSVKIVERKRRKKSYYSDLTDGD